MNTQDSQSELGNILDDLVNMKKPARFHNTDWAEYAIEAYVTTRVKEALELARSKDPHKCEFGHEVYSHNTVDGWCCACEADQAFMEAEIEARVKEAERLEYNFSTHKKLSRVQSLDKNHISITSAGISFGKTKPPYERVVIEYDKKLNAIRFHEPKDGEYGISYKAGTNPATGSYGFRARPFEGILPPGYYLKISEHTYRLEALTTTTNGKEEK